MNPKARLSLGIIGVSVILGMMGDYLLRTTPWGLNVFVWMGVSAAWITWLVMRLHVPLTPGVRWLVPCLIATAALYIWRDSPTLRQLNTIAIFLLLAFASWSASGASIFRSGVLGCIARLAIAGLEMVFGGVLLLAGASLKAVAGPDAKMGPRFVRAVRIGVGLAAAVPLVLLFGGLFMSADHVYKQLIVRLFYIDPGELMLHIMFTAGIAWLAGGYLRSLLMKELKPPEDAVLCETGKATVETNVVLIALNLLFFSFIMVQLPYLFGGSDRVATTSGLTYAEYARHGFSELVCVAALVLPLLLAADWLVGDTPSRRYYKLLAGGLVAMLFVIMASAVKRMLLYQSEYGLTELRVYTTAFMGWLALLFIWYCATVLNGQRHRFVGGSIVAGFLVFAGLHAINPDDLIVRTNLAHHRAGKTFDAEYASKLSADAAPALAEALKELPASARDLIAVRLQGHAGNAMDWRTWNLSRERARNAAESAASIGLLLPSVSTAQAE